jgi:hypothetical protein
MPCPFPGMDPYLEDPGVFPGFHNALASEITRCLNATLPAPYYASLEARQELGIGWDESPRIAKPDVAVAADPWGTARGGTAAALAEEIRTEVSPSIALNCDIEPTDAYFVEIRDARSGHELVTLIEILSPSNKVAGRDREQYLTKRAAILASRTSLIELDLLRLGERAYNELDYAEALERQVPACPYLVAINRSWHRSEIASRAYEVFPVSLRGPLPVIPIPLRDGEPEPTLDLQYIFRETYAAGPYQRGAVNYRQEPPPPPLSADDLAWARQQLEPRSPATT